MLQPVFTAPIFAVHGLLDGARGKGLATQEWLEGVLGRAGISESLLDLEDSRVTVEQFNALFIAVKDSLNDECLGYLHGRPMRPGSFALMVRSAFTAHSLSYALRRLSESFALLQDDVALVPVTEGALGGFALEMRGGAGAHAEFLHAHLLRVFWRLLLWLHGGRLVPQRFDFNFAQPLHAMSYGRIFSGTLCFGQPRTAAWFDADAFKQPVRRDRDALQSFLRATPGNVVGPHLNERSASARSTDPHDRNRSRRTAGRQREDRVTERSHRHTLSSRTAAVQSSDHRLPCDAPGFVAHIAALHARLKIGSAPVRHRLPHSKLKSPARQPGF